MAAPYLPMLPCFLNLLSQGFNKFTLCAKLGHHILENMYMYMCREIEGCLHGLALWDLMAKPLLCGCWLADRGRG